MKRLNDEQRLDLAYEAAYYLEHAQLTEVVERLSSPGKLMKQQFISGVVAGLMAAVGLTVAFSIVAALLGTVGTHLPGKFGESARHTSQSLTQKADK